MLIALASCQNQEKHENRTQQQLTEKQERQSSDYSETQTESTAVSVTENKSTSFAISTTSEIKTETTVNNTDPSDWSAEETVEFYKASAIKSQNKVKSVQKMTLKELSVNDGDGKKFEYEMEWSFQKLYLMPERRILEMRR